MQCIEKAYAKINLGIRILGKRRDGFHDILSVFQTVDLYDTLSLDSSDTTSLDCSIPGIPTDERNLILKAYSCFCETTGFDNNTCFTLDKIVPTGAGLGGGSADAAATLRALERFSEKRLSDENMHRCACTLGSDVPFLVKGGTAIVSGRGENIDFVRWPFDYSYVIVHPGFGVSTPWAYDSLRGFRDDNGVYSDMTGHLRRGTLTDALFFDALVNDFETTVCEHHPEITSIKHNLVEYGALKAIMTGSGSAVFGIFDSSSHATLCAETLRQTYKSVFVAKPVSNIR